MFELSFSRAGVNLTLGEVHERHSGVFIDRIAFACHADSAANEMSPFGVERFGGNRVRCSADANIVMIISQREFKMRCARRLSACLAYGCTFLIAFASARAIADEAVAPAQAAEGVIDPVAAVPTEEVASDHVAPNDAEVENAEWKPLLIVTLMTTEDGAPLRSTRKVRVPAYKDSFSHVNQGGSIVRVPIRELIYKEQMVATSSAGTATLFCDDLALSVSKQPDAVGYSFECSGRLQLRLDGLLMDCDSGKLSNGKLELTNVRVVHAGTGIASEKSTVNINVKGVRTAEFGQQLPPESCDLVPPDLVQPPHFPPYVVPEPLLFERDDVDRLNRGRTYEPDSSGEFSPRDASVRDFRREDSGASFDAPQPEDR